MRSFLATSALAVLGAVLLTTAAAGIAEAAGTDFVVDAGREPVPLAGFAVVTAIFSALGVMLALGFRRWAQQPDDLFGKVAVTLTAISLVLPFTSAADTGPAFVLAGLHLVAAAVMIPALTWALRR